MDGALTAQEAYVLKARAHGWTIEEIAFSLGRDTERTAQIAKRARYKEKRKARRDHDEAERAVQQAYLWLMRSRAMLALGDV